MLPKTSTDMLHIHAFFLLVFYKLVLLQWFTWTYMYRYMYRKSGNIRVIKISLQKYSRIKIFVA